MHVLIWQIENQPYAIDLAAVDYLFLAAEITPIPHAPVDILGVLNISGQVIPVINMRKLLGIAQKEIEATDHFILSRVYQKQIILWVDKVCCVKLCLKEELIPVQEVLPDLDEVEYALKEDGQIILFYDLERLIPEAILKSKNASFKIS